MRNINLYNFVYNSYNKFNNIFAAYKQRSKLDNTTIFNCNIRNHANYDINRLLKFVNICKRRNMKIYCSQTHINYTYKMLIGKNELGEYIMLRNIVD